MPETIDEAEEALLGSGLGFYQRGSIVVRPAMVPVAISGGRHIDAPRLVHVKALRVAGEGGAINGTRLGKWLSQHQNRVVAGHPAADICRTGALAHGSHALSAGSDGRAVHVQPV